MTEHNLRRSAVIGLVATFALMFAAYLIGGMKIFERTYTLTAEFSDASDVGGGDPVRVAGIEVGKVKSIERLPQSVRMKLELRKGAELSKGTSASIRLRTLLGKKYVNLNDPGTGPLLKSGDVIPNSKTEPATDVDTVVTSFEGTLEETNVDSMNALLRSMEKVMEGKGDEVNVLLRDLGSLASTVAQRQADIDRLITASDKLMGAVDDRRVALSGSVEGMAATLDGLAARKAELASLVTGIRDLSGQLTPLLQRNEKNLDGLITEVVETVKIIDGKRERVELALDQLPDAVYALHKVTRQGSWINVYNIGYPMYPYFGNPVDTGDGNGQDPGRSGGLPNVWFRPPAQAPGVNAFGIDVDTDNKTQPPPEGYRRTP